VSDTASVIQGHSQKFGRKAAGEAIASIVSLRLNRPYLKPTFGGATGHHCAHDHAGRRRGRRRGGNGWESTAAKFVGGRQHRVIPNVGHNLPQEDPAAFAAAVWELASKKR
jgi:hypothetical protein